MPEVNKVPAILQELREQYANSDSSKYVNMLVYGHIGTGKTTLLRTAVKPVLIDSFDPGGTKVLKKEIERGEVVVDNRFEKEDAKSPTSYELWDKTFLERKRDGVFDQVGTYVIDSLTAWSEALMNQILKQNGRAGQSPQMQNYLVQITQLAQYVRILANLPCHVVLLGHVDAKEDEVTGKVTTGVMVTGKLKVKIPILLDEMYLATTKETSKGIDYRLLTRNTGQYEARTRIGSDGMFDTYEKPDIKALLNKAGYSTEDKKPY